MASEKRLIDANEVVHYYFTTYYGGEFIAVVPVAEIEAAPTVDAVEVVRCKDCTHYDNDKCICNFHSEEPKIYATFSVDMTPDDFCSYGERENNEQT